MKKELDDNIWHEHLSGKADKETEKEVLEYAKTSKENAEKLFMMEELSQMSGFYKKMDDTAVDKAFLKVKKNVERKEQRRSRFLSPRKYIQYAAILVVALLSGW